MNTSWHPTCPWVVLLGQQEAKLRTVMGWIKSEWAWRWSDLEGCSSQSKVHCSITPSDAGYWSKLPQLETLVVPNLWPQNTSQYAEGRQVCSSQSLVWAAEGPEPSWIRKLFCCTDSQTPPAFTYVRKSQVLRDTQILGKLLSRINNPPLFIGNQGQLVKLNS